MIRIETTKNAIVKNKNATPFESEKWSMISATPGVSEKKAPARLNTGAPKTECEL